MSVNPLKQAIQQLKTMNVLYVEDELSARDEIAYFLESKVKKLYLAENGQEGLKIFQENLEVIDIVISDIQMPIMNGLEMSVAIKKINSEIPIVITSAFNDNEYLFKAIETGISHYIPKPVDLMQLVIKIAQIAEDINLKREVEFTKKSLEAYQCAIDRSMFLSKTDPNGVITYVNEKFCLLTGFSSSELVGREEKILWESIELSNSRYEKVFTTLKEEKFYKGTISYKTKYGTGIVLDLTVFPIMDELDEISGYVFVHSDITELVNYRKILEQRLNINQVDLREKMHFLGEYQKALDLGTALCRMSIKGNITFANKTFIDQLQYEGKDILTENYFGLCFFDNVEKGVKQLKDIILNDKVFHSTIGHNKSDGSKTYLSVVFVPIFNEKGEVVEIVGIHYDLTEILALNQEIQETQKEIIYTLGEVTENRSNETGNHIKRVAEYSFVLARHLGLDKDESEIIKVASTMHDIGKVAIEDHILKKPGKLTNEEFDRMKEHAQIGFHIFENSKRPVMKAAAIIARDHHEKWNGFGYPQGLKGEEIHLYGRIVALADVFDALGSDRVYKKTWELDKILNLLKEERGKHFDPHVVDIFFENLDEILKVRDTYKD